MKKTLSLAFLALACASTDANAWFFFFFPLPLLRGSGDICVSASAKAGDSFRSPNGNVGTIKSTSGTSSRCRQSDKPVIAEVEFVMSTAFTPKAGMKLPDGFAPQSLSDLQRFNGMLLLAKDNAKDSGVIVTSTKHDVIPDAQTYAANLRVNQTLVLDEAQQSEIEQLTVNGIQAWRFETRGKLKNLFGTRYTYLTTVLEGEQEVVAINAWTGTGNYEAQKEELKQLAANVTGITALPPAAAGSPPGPLPVAAPAPSATGSGGPAEAAMPALPAVVTTETKATTAPVALDTASAAGLEQLKASHPGSVLNAEPPVGTIRYLEIVYIDDKSCPPGQIRELTGGSPSRGIARENRCIRLPQ